jgi:hypothetical protein
MNSNTVCIYTLSGEGNEIFVEPESGIQQPLTGNCFVCKRPNVLHIEIVIERIFIQSEFEG